MLDEAPHRIAITLSPAQVEEVLRAACSERPRGVFSPIAAALADPRTRERARGSQAPPGRAAEDVDDDRRLSRSLMRGLAMLTCFAGDSDERGIVELAHELGMSASTAHRYAMTLLELGLLERSPRTRKYRLPGELAR